MSSTIDTSPILIYQYDILEYSMKMAQPTIITEYRGIRYVSFYVTTDLVERVDRKIKPRGISRSAYIRDAINEKLEREPKIGFVG